MSSLVVALGEILFDRFGEQIALGGAPTNFAGHVAALGTPAAIVSAIGRDELGDQAYNELQGRSIDMSGVTSNDFPTGTVDVVLQNGQPRYTINEPAAWDAIVIDDVAIALLRRASALCFGTLAQRSPKSREAIRQAVEACADRTLKLLDVNLRAPFYNNDVIRESIAICNAVKLNEEEVAVVAQALQISEDDNDFAASLIKEFGIRFLMITRGANGATLYRDSERCEVAPVAVSNMVSTVGAGDSFAAAAVCGYHAGDSLENIGRAAAQRAAKTCTHAGGLPLMQ